MLLRCQCRVPKLFQADAVCRCRSKTYNGRKRKAAQRDLGMKMKTVMSVSCTFGLLAGGAGFAGQLCYAVADTALYADAGLSQDVRPIFQFDGAQFVPTARDGETMFGMAYDVRMQPMLEENSFVRASDWTCEDLAAASSDDAGAASDELVYDVSEAACKLDLSDTRVTLSGSTMSFYEAGCDILSEELGADGSRLLSLLCYGGGDEWSATASITPRTDGEIEMKVDQYLQTYMPCG